MRRRRTATPTPCAGTSPWASTSTGRTPTRCVLRRRRARTTEREGPRHRAPLPAARALGRETTNFASRALVRRAACPRRRGDHGGPGVTETHFSRSRAPPRAASARVPRNVRRVFPARAPARALASPPSRARATRRRGPRDASAAPARRNGTECDTSSLSLACPRSLSRSPGRPRCTAPLTQTSAMLLHRTQQRWATSPSPRCSSPPGRA